MSYRSISRADSRARQNLTGGRAATLGKNGFVAASPTQSAGSLHQQRLGEVWRIVRENQRLQGTPPVPPRPGPGGGAEGQ